MVTAVLFSATVTVAVSPLAFDVTIGGSFTGAMVRVNVSDALSDPSLAVTLNATWPLKLAGGIPEKLRVAALKVSHAGSGLPSARLATYASASPSTSLKALAGMVKFQAVSSGEL